MQYDVTLNWRDCPLEKNILGETNFPFRVSLRAFTIAHCEVNAEWLILSVKNLLDHIVFVRVAINHKPNKYHAPGFPTRKD